MIKKKAILQIDSCNIDAGLQKANTNFVYKFTLKNIGTDTAMIDKVETTCGGVYPFITKNKIAPGESARIVCDYNFGGILGYFNKTINVFTTAKIVGKYQKNQQTNSWNDWQ